MIKAYSGQHQDETDDVGREEEVVGFLSPVLGGEGNNHVEAKQGNCSPDGIGVFHALFECPIQGPFVI